MQRKSVAIVTGASQGIGRATAIRLARDFEAVVLAARQEDELSKTASAVESAGAEAFACALDLREPGSADVLIQGTLNRFERAMNCGAITEEAAIEMTGLTLPELHSKSFANILANRRHSVPQ